MKLPSSQHFFHHVIIILLLIIFPPIAWYQMWKKPRFHPWFSYVLWLNGVITMGIFGYFLFYAYPKLTQILASSGADKTRTATAFTIHILLLIFGIFEVAVGVYLKKHFRNAALLTKPQITLVIFLLFLNLLTIPISQLAITAAVPHVKENPIATTPLDPTANWKTYHFVDKDGFGYEIKIPNDWVNYPWAGHDSTSLGPNELLQNFYDGDKCNRVYVLHFYTHTRSVGINEEITNFDSIKGHYEIRGANMCREAFNKNIYAQILSTFKSTDQETPEKVTEDFYRWYTRCATYIGVGDKSCDYRTHQALSDKFIKNAKNILCALNVTTNIKVDKASINNNTATVIVHTIFQESGDNPILVDLEKINNQWKLTNITCNR